ncbi:hypothetical protein [Cyclobacterium sp. SYSU L10401]|uniref:hypothetical protein n=1 Tax=Cyclobacterium sp. SYSU L10401 TaxID=2678657 RepID=UPI0013D8BD69|nr:hypothetical protein [Cyclobacterium sp. SYSU L10401]
MTEKEINQIIRSFQKLDINSLGVEGLNSSDEICNQVEDEYSASWNIHKEMICIPVFSFLVGLINSQKMII